MCGRYFLKATEAELRALFGFIERPNLPAATKLAPPLGLHRPPHLAARYNIAPTQEAPVVRQRRVPEGERTIQQLRWGLIPAWAEDAKAAPPLINARAETLLEK